MNKLRTILDKILTAFSAFLLAFMTVLVTWQVITRFLLHSPSTITEALAKYLFLWLIMITSAYIVGKRDHMNLQFFINKLPQDKRRIFGIISEAVIFLFSAAVLVYGGGYIAINAMSQMDSALPVPVGIIYLALPAGGILCVFYSLCNIIDLVKQNRGGAK